ncbi:MAG: hypothetical protein Q8Q52_07640, partial [Acidimicrobiia bacterium]|nr:hypothetical protein [Acidimicrobiia bacterium]
PGGSGAIPNAGPWDDLRRMLSPRLSPAIVNRLLSPLLVVEVVLSAMARSGAGILLPTGMLGALVAWLLWRRRPRVERIGDAAPISFLPERQASQRAARSPLTGKSSTGPIRSGRRKG